MSDVTQRLTTEIEDLLGQSMPEVEVVLAEQPSPGLVRVYIDRPGGVDLELCERVTHALAPVRQRYALEVSSPGSDRPLVRPQHYRRFLGREVTVSPSTGDATFAAASAPQASRTSNSTRTAGRCASRTGASVAAASRSSTREA
jgi:ribosome maturation factor RimP